MLIRRRFIASAVAGLAGLFGVGLVKKASLPSKRPDEAAKRNSFNADELMKAIGFNQEAGLAGAMSIVAVASVQLCEHWGKVVAVLDAVPRDQADG